MTTIYEKARQLGPDLLGNWGAPYSEVITIETDRGPLRLQQFWNCSIWEYPTNATADGRDCTVYLEGTLPYEVVDKFRTASGKTGAVTAVPT